MRYRHSFVLACGALISAALFAACAGSGDPEESKAVDPEVVGEAQQPVEAGACTANQDSPTCRPASCGEHRCGGFLWKNAVIPYQISSTLIDVVNDPDVQTIDDAAAAWNDAAGNVVRWEKCTNNNCSGKPRFVTFTLCNGCSNPFTANDVITVYNNTSFRTAAHEMGHAIGLPHTFWRHDRDRYVTMDPAVCANYWSCQMGDNTDSANPPVATGQFGVYESTSLMNYGNFPTICEKDGQEPASTDGITNIDGSNVQELYRTVSGWAPFQNLGKDVSATDPLNHNLVSSGTPVYMIGAASTSSWGAPLLDIFVRGSDNHIYYKWKNVSSGVFQSWSSWTDMGGDFNSDPASVSWASGRTDLVARKSDGNIYIKTFSSGSWSGWSNIGAPSGGAASAPAITSWGTGRLDVFVRGSDDRLWQRTYQNGWEPSWNQRGSGTFRGKPAAVSWGSNRIDVAVHGDDDALWVTWFDGTWHGYTSLGGELHHTGGIFPSYSSPAISARGSDKLNIFIRGMDSRLWQKAWTGSAWTNYYQLGGVITGDPASVGEGGSSTRIEVIAPNTDHGIRGVWRKYWPFDAGCLVEGATCGACGCDDDPNSALPDCRR